jgi:hypothetical protein
VRPHVESISTKDYIWHKADLVGGTGDAREQRLSYDEEDGSCSLRVQFDTAWSRPQGVHDADTEWFLLEGEMTVGDKTMGPGAYLQAPKGALAPAVSFTAGSLVLHFREYGQNGFEATDTARADATHEATIVDSGNMEYDAVLTVGPPAGLYIKLLHRDPETGFYTRLIRGDDGWPEHRLAHHPCYEEAYCLNGHMDYNFGSFDPGDYFFRPALIKHGHFSLSGGCEWILRSDGELINWYTTEEWIKWGGRAENYGKEPDSVYENTTQFASGEERAHQGYNHAFPSVSGHVQHPIPSTMPVRSKTIGAWNGDGM